MVKQSVRSAWQYCAWNTFPRARRKANCRPGQADNGGRAQGGIPRDQEPRQTASVPPAGTALDPEDRESWVWSRGECDLSVYAVPAGGESEYLLRRPGQML